MQVFKTAVKIALRHPLYLLIYAVGISFMGVFMTSGLPSDTPAEEFTPQTARFSVVDRDQSALSHGLTTFLQTQGTEVPLQDDTLALQDAVAKGDSGYILVVPENFGSTFMAAVADGRTMPTLDATYSYSSIEGNLSDQQVNEYLRCAYTYARLSGDTSLASLATHTASTMKESAVIQGVASENVTAKGDQFVFYLQYSCYTLFASIVVCVGIMMSIFNRTEVRRRNLTSPLPGVSLSLQKAGGGFFIAVLVWAWNSGLGFAVFNHSLAGVPPFAVGLMLLSSLAFTTVPLATGFLLGQLGTSEFACNSIGNIGGLVIAFLGGAWVPLTLLGPEMQAIAHFSPALWYTQALTSAAEMTELTPAMMAPVLGNIGVLLLFAAAVFSIALVAGRLRLQSAEAGGNAAAQGI
ncbi:MAG: ABC transporter permease [Clostridia bacterium]